MKNDDRKAAVNAYKERKAVAGIYALRCVPSGQVWVGRAPDVETIANRVMFSLRQNSTTNPLLKVALKDHAPETFAVEILERLDDEDSAYVRDSLLKERLAYWRSKIGAETI